MSAPLPAHGDAAGAAPVLVIGATGRVGRGVVGELVRLGRSVRALTRRAPADAGLPAAVDVVTADLTAPDSLEPALRDIDVVFLVWTAPPDAVPAVVDRLARRVRRVVLLSAPYRTPHPFFQQPNPMAALYADLEERIAAAGLALTVVRPGMFASNTLSWWAPAIRAGAPVRWPYAAVETAPVDDRDVVAVATRVLVAQGHAGGDYVLTGPESLSQAEQVAAIGDVLGRPVAFEELTAAQFRAETDGVWPRPVVEMLLAAWDAASDRPAFLSPAVADLLGRPARTYREWAADHIAEFDPR